jgi:death-on-curing protein
MTIRFLSTEEVLAIHRDQTQRYGGSPLIRDRQLLNSALAQPSATFEGRYLNSGPFEMAAAYLFHVTMNHPFIDGNKRTGLAAALIFLYYNGIELAVDENALAQMVWAVARGEMNKKEVSGWFREHARRK